MRNELAMPHSLIWPYFEFMTNRIAHETRMNRARFASVAAQIVVLLYKQFCRFLHDVIVRLRYFLSFSLSLSLSDREPSVKHFIWGLSQQIRPQQNQLGKLVKSKMRLFLEKEIKNGNGKRKRKKEKKM